MGTRATYEVNGQVFYCHWDGYREGAAVRFAKMVAAMIEPEPEDGEGLRIDAIRAKRGGAAFAFIRGNNDAEPAYRGGHDGHGDTEFRYRVADHPAHGLTVAVEERHWNSERDWRGFGAAQPLAAFVNAYGRKFDAPRIVTVAEPTGWGPPRVQLATLDTARAIAERLRQLGERFDESNPNRRGYLGKAEAWRRAVEEEETAAA